jgi:hypothetical protein
MSKENNKQEVYQWALRLFNVDERPAPGCGHVGAMIIESRIYTASPPDWETTKETLSARDVMEQVWSASEFLFGERIADVEDATHRIELKREDQL